MKTNQLFFALTIFLFSITVNAQVGVGNTNPQASLDVTASSTTAPANNDGILIPRMSNFPTAPGAARDGMLIFYTGTASSGKGFYYWDDSLPDWVFLSGAKKINDLLDGKSDDDGTQNGSSLFLGELAGLEDDGSDNRNVGIGYFSLAEGANRTNNTAVGYYSLTSNDQGNNNSALGSNSLFFNRFGDNNTAIGYQSLYFNNNGENNVALGYRAGYDNMSGNNNTFIGYNTGNNINIDGGVFIGYTAGSNNSTNNTLYIENTNANASNALIYGEFGADNTSAGNMLRTNSEFQIGDPSGTGYAFPIADGTNGQVMTTDGTGNITFQTISAQNNSASNGLNEVGADIRLGGILTENTTITQATSSFDINLNSTGDFAIQDSGTDVFFIEDSGDIGIGNSNPAYPLHITESVNGTTRGIFIDKTDNSGAETSGLYVDKTGGGNGRSHAIFTDVNGSGNGQKYGIFNRITSSANGGQYGTRNFLSGATASFQFGTFNNIDNGGTGNQYGVYNGMRGASAANLYGVYNEFERNYSGVNEIVGTLNRFSSGTPGGGGMMGVYTDFSTSTNGNFYGTRNEFQAAATGTGNKYGTYNQISSSAGGTHYGTYNNVNVNDGWAGYFLGKNYISNRLSIGETNNPNSSLNVRTNSSGTLSHIELRETQANDGARIRFSNTVETANQWTLYGRSDDTTADGRFNLFHTTTGNILVATGNGDVGITGTPNTDFHVYHGNNGNVSGMKLQNTNDNTWWRFYVSSGSDDLRLFNSNNGNTIMGVFNDASGVYTPTSDRRLKKDFKNLYFDWKNFMKLAPLTYKYKKDKKNARYIGMVAQDVEKIYPELISYSKEEDIYHMDYSSTGIVAIKAIQELKIEVEELRQENKNLKQQLNKLQQLEARLFALETQNNSDDLETTSTTEK